MKLSLITLYIHLYFVYIVYTNYYVVSEQVNDELYYFRLQEPNCTADVSTDACDHGDKDNNGVKSIYDTCYYKDAAKLS